MHSQDNVRLSERICASERIFPERSVRRNKQEWARCKGLRLGAQATSPLKVMGMKNFAAAHKTHCQAQNSLIVLLRFGPMIGVSDTYWDFESSWVWP